MFCHSEVGSLIHSLIRCECFIKWQRHLHNRICVTMTQQMKTRKKTNHQKKDEQKTNIGFYFFSLSKFREIFRLFPFQCNFIATICNNNSRKNFDLLPLNNNNKLLLFFFFILLLSYQSCILFLKKKKMKIHCPLQNSIVRYWKMENNMGRQKKICFKWIGHFVPFAIFFTIFLLLSIFFKASVRRKKQQMMKNKWIVKWKKNNVLCKYKHRKIHALIHMYTSIYIYTYPMPIRIKSIKTAMLNYIVLYIWMRI